MSLIQLVDNTKTDKNTIHSYLGLYEKLLSPKIRLDDLSSSSSDDDDDNVSRNDDA